MKLTNWSFQGLTIPMMEDDDGELYCTSQAVCGALGINENTLRYTYTSHKEEFTQNCVGNPNAIEFLKKYRKEFSIKYLRGDMKLWYEDDMMTFAFHAKSKGAMEFRKELRQFIKAHARRETVSRSEHESLLARFDALQNLVMCSMSGVNDSASLAGSFLSAQKKTKTIREMSYH